MTGRRSKATEPRVEAVLNALRAGNTRNAAAAYAEIGRTTFYRWLEDDGTFRDAVEKAEADAEVRFASQVAKAATNGTWQAAAWWLERRRPQSFALQSKVEMSGPDGGPIQTRELAAGFSDHEKTALAHVLREAIAAAEVVEE